MESAAEGGLKIGQLAEEAGIHLETIRYYQRLGLMPTPRRTHGTVRRYKEDAVARLRFLSAKEG